MQKNDIKPIADPVFAAAVGAKQIALDSRPWRPYFEAAACREWCILWVGAELLLTTS